MYVFNKEGIKNKITFYEGKETRSDLQVAVTKSDKKICGKWTLKKVLCIVRTD